MGQSYSADLRKRVVAFVDAGHSRRAAARHFAAGDSFAVKLMQRVAAPGSCEPGRQGRPPGKGKLAPYAAFLTGIVETQLAPALSPGDIVILDNLAVHKSPKAARILKSVGALFLFLPPYRPDLNPIEMAFSKLKAHLRAAGARTFDALWRAIGGIGDLFSPQECWNDFVSAGYASD